MNSFKRFKTITDLTCNAFSLACVITSIVLRSIRMGLTLIAEGPLVVIFIKKPRVSEFLTASLEEKGSYQNRGRPFLEFLFEKSKKFYVDNFFHIQSKGGTLLCLGSNPLCPQFFCPFLSQKW